MLHFKPFRGCLTLYLYVAVLFLKLLRIHAGDGVEISIQPSVHETLVVGNSLPQETFYHQYQPVYTPATYYTPLIKPIYHIPPSYYTSKSHYSGSKNQDSSSSSQENNFITVVTNVTADMRGRLEVPYGERLTFALTFPSMNEDSYNKALDHSRQVKFKDEPTVNIGTIISDTFVLKERGISINSLNIPNAQPNAAILDGILKNVLNNRGKENARSSSESGRSDQSQIHSPGDLILREIPIGGSIDYSGLNNLTEFLIEETSRARPSKSHNKPQEQAPMFVAVQYHTVGRNKVKTYEEGAEKKTSIHVVLGHKHFEFRNIHQLNKLYDYVKPDYYVYKPIHYFDKDYNYYVPLVQTVLIPSAPKFYIKKATVDLIVEFVEYVWDIHKDTHDASKARGKDITRRLTDIILKNQSRRKGEKKFRPDGGRQTPEIDFFTWPYTNTLAYRTLMM